MQGQAVEEIKRSGVRVWKCAAVKNLPESLEIEFCDYVDHLTRLQILTEDKPRSEYALHNKTSKDTSQLKSFNATSVTQEGH